MKFYFFVLLGFFICCIGKPKLNEFSYHFCSRTGEDGVLRKIFEVMGTTSKICIEFGAEDGFHYSNTVLLRAASGWKAILIEGDKDKFEHLKHTMRYFKNCVLIHTYIGVGKEDSLEEVLKINNIINTIDLLSIKIGGNDYYILESLKDLHPRVIMCEYNKSMPATLDIYPEKNNKLGQNGLGCSVAALVRIAEIKGYKLVALTDDNCFFVVKEEFDKFQDFETSLVKLRIDKYLKNVITDYKGNYAVIGEQKDYCYGDLKDPLDVARILGNIFVLNDKFQKS